MGNRFKGGIAPGAMPLLHRYLGNPVLSFIGRLFFRSPIGDFHCGLRGFARDAIARAAASAHHGMEFASEMVVKATLAGSRIAEVPTTLSPDGRSRPPHLRTWRDGWRHLRFLLMFARAGCSSTPASRSPAWERCSLALIPGPVVIGAVTLDGASLLFAVAAILVGAQLVGFYALAKLHAVSEGLLPESRRYRRAVRLLTVDRFCQAAAPWR